MLTFQKQDEKENKKEEPLWSVIKALGYSFKEQNMENGEDPQGRQRWAGFFIFRIEIHLS